MQGAHAGGRGLRVRGLAHPAGQALPQFGQQFLGFLLEHREELGIRIVGQLRGGCGRPGIGWGRARLVVEQTTYQGRVGRFVEPGSEEVQQPLQVLDAGGQHRRLVLDGRLDGAHPRQRAGQRIAHLGEFALPDPGGPCGDHLGQLDATRIG